MGRRICGKNQKKDLDEPERGMETERSKKDPKKKPG